MESQDPGKTKAEAEDDAPPATILVIDDEDVVHVSLRRILGRRGHTVETASSAADGLEMLSKRSYDLVITDLMMPEMNGIELLQELKKRPTRPPILMITGYPTIKTALQALRLGAVDYLAKPFTRKELLAPVNRALRRLAGNPEGSLVPPPPTPPPDGLEPPVLTLDPGDRYHLRRHSWVVYQQDGTVEIGIEPSFLDSIGALEEIHLPGEEEVVEQGYVGIRIKTTSGEEHGVLMPLSGRVIASNDEAARDVSKIDSTMWLVRLLPDRLQSELEHLVAG